MSFRIKRIYDAPAEGDGLRVLVDRLWPRGVAKSAAGLDEWMKDVAPSDPLRRWFNHESDRFAAFREAYLEELSCDPLHQELVDRLRRWAEEQTVTLLYAAKDPVHHHAAVLLEHLQRDRV